MFEGIVAFTAGILAGSVARVGFGVDSFIERTSAGVVAGGYAPSSGGSRQQTANASSGAPRASLVAGVLLLLHLDRTERGGAGEDLDLHVGDARHGVDG